RRRRARRRGPALGVGSAPAARARAGPRPGRGADLAGVLADGHGRAAPGGRRRQPGAQPHRGPHGEVARAPPPQRTIRRTHPVATPPPAALRFFFRVTRALSFIRAVTPRRSISSLYGRKSHGVRALVW